MTSTSNNLSLTACVHCRRHKIRCSRQFPDCGRCSRLGLTCDYPNPPDRRQIANLRNGPLYNDDSSANLHGNESINCTKTSHGDHVSSSSIIPPTEVMIQLIDIYFDCVFNANLLFHRPSFMEDLEKGSIKEHVLLSVISVASILSRSAHSPSGTSIESPSRHWAEIASASALQSADCGGLDVVQACENLALYWWATNEPHRAHVHSMTSYTVSQMLCLRLLTSSPSEMTAEVTRRCFWSCWIKHCVQDVLYPGLVQPQCPLKLLLPCDDFLFDRSDSFEESTIPNSELLSDTPTSESASSGQSASMVRIFSLWMRVKNHVYSDDSKHGATHMGQILELDRDIRQLSAIIPNQIQDHDPSISALGFNRIKSAMLFSAYHQCLLLLHMSSCPALSNRISAEDRSPMLSQLAAQAVTSSTIAILDLISQLLTESTDAAKISPYIGYCAFTSGVICVILYRLTTHEPFAKYAQVALLLLSNLAAYWPVLRQKHEKLRDLIEQYFASTTTNSPSNVNLQTRHRDMQTMNSIGASTLSQPSPATLVPLILCSLPFRATYTGNIDGVSYEAQQTRDIEHRSGRKHRGSPNTPFNPQAPQNSDTLDDALIYNQSESMEQSMEGLFPETDLLQLLFGNTWEMSERCFPEPDP